MILVLDIETTFTLQGKNKNPSPYLYTNQLVSVGILAYDGTNVITDYIFFHHESRKFDVLKAAITLQGWLDKATLIVGHNLKFDLSWLMESSFKVPEVAYDTMIADYVMARGLPVELSLEALCTKYSLLSKKTSLVQEYLDKNIGFDNIPVEIVQEYGEGDIRSTFELYLHQQKRLEEKENIGLLRVIKMMNEYLFVLIEMERNGAKIDLEELNRLDVEYSKEQQELLGEFHRLIAELNGGNPINPNSPQQLSEFVFSRKVKDKKVWKELFNLGNGRKLKRYNQAEFNEIVREHTEITRVNGKVVGLKCAPKDVTWVTVNGFSASKEIIDDIKLRYHTNENVQKFCELISRIGAISTYKDTFIAGIREYTDGLDFLHTNFNQCVTATGRLSSSRPNLQNQPRAKTFPVRGCFISRFDNGVIVECDYKGLEYRVAVDLAKDAPGIHDIENGIDAHLFTASHTGLSRQDSKPHTFAPLYGASPEGKPEHIGQYYRAFMLKHKGIARMHELWGKTVIATKRLVLPSGREYDFPGTKRLWTGYITNSTRWKNYPVQGFATADVVPTGGIALYKALKQTKAKSKLFLTVHDNFCVDVHPDEIEWVPQLVKDTLNNTAEFVYEKFGYRFGVPIIVEAKYGLNLLTMKEF